MDSFQTVFATVWLLYGVCLADISHFFAPDFSFFQHQQFPHSPFQVMKHQPATQPSVPSLYAAPPQHQGIVSGYPNPLGPTSVPASVATTTEFTLPEIIENRQRQHFIPLHNQYVPPEEQRPHYEVPKPPQQGESQVYYYPKPGTTTERPRPIVVMDPIDFHIPISTQPAPVGSGYDYNAPQVPPPLLPLPVAPIRPSTPAPLYLPPNNVHQSQDAVVVEYTDAAATPLHLHVEEMRCMQQHGGYFRAVLKVDSFIGATPSVDNDAYDRQCELKLSRSYVLVKIFEEHFQTCGVRSCGRDLCLRLRFPAIRGMRTAADAILTLHCKTQDRVAVKTHAIEMGVANDGQARSSGTYAHGGSQNTFRTHVELLRKTGNGYTRHLKSNGAVQLGEELLLRAHVLVGDGWNYTKLTDVSLQRISPSGELLNTANLVTPHGCLNPSMQSICVHPPVYDPPLGHKLTFKAVMFQGMNSGDELVISMRITGCLEQRDCYIGTQECASGVGGLGRRRRDTMEEILEQDTPKNGTEISEISRISFRVMLPMNKNLQRNSPKKIEVTGGEEHSLPKITEIEFEEVEIIATTLILALVGSLGLVILLLGLGIFIVVKLGI